MEGSVMVKMALGMAEKHAAKLDALADKAQKGGDVRTDIAALAKEFKGQVATIRKAAEG